MLFKNSIEETHGVRISPKRKPMISKRIKDKNPITTNPTANDECAKRPRRASPGNLVFFCNFNKIRAIIDDIIKTERAILTSKVKARVTPKRAECANVSPKKASLLQIIKHPSGPVTKAIPIPAINALIKKSSNI